MRKLLFLLLFIITLTGCSKQVETDVVDELETITADDFLGKSYLISAEDTFISIRYNRAGTLCTYEIDVTPNTQVYNFVVGDATCKYILDKQGAALYRYRELKGELSKEMTKLSKEVDTSKFSDSTEAVNFTIQNVTAFTQDIDSGIYKLNAKVNMQSDSGTNNASCILEISEDMEQVISLNISNEQFNTARGTSSLYRDKGYFNVDNQGWRAVPQTDMLQDFYDDLVLYTMFLTTTNIYQDESYTDEETITTEVEEVTDVEPTEFSFVPYDNKILKGSDVLKSLDSLRAEQIAVLVINGDSSVDAYNYSNLLSNSFVNEEGYIVCPDIWEGVITTEVNYNSEPLYVAGNPFTVEPNADYYTSLLLDSDGYVIGVLFQMTAESLNKYYSN